MTTRHETAYRTLKADYSEKELRRLYTPTGAEQAFVREMSRTATAQLAVLVHLKTFQYLGYFVLLAEVPETIIRLVAGAAGMRVPGGGRLQRYDQSGAKRQHVTALRLHLNVRPLRTDSDKAWLATVAERAAEVRHQVPDVINFMLEELARHRYEIPGYSTLERLADMARKVVHDRYLSAIAKAVTPGARTLIDQLLGRRDGAALSGWNALKREPKKPTNKEVRFTLQHIQRLKQLVEQLPAIDIPVVKMRFFQQWARALDASQLSRLNETTRYALAAVFIRSQRGKALDEAADLFLRLVQKLENTARQKLLNEQFEQSQRADELIAQLKGILQAYQIEGSDTQRIDAIGNTLQADVAPLLIECDKHLAFAGKNYLPFLLAPYAKVRSLLLNCIEIMELKSASQDPSTARLLRILAALRPSRREFIEPGEAGIDVDKDLDWLSALWRRHVLTPNPLEPSAFQLQRRYLELAILYEVRQELKSGDLYVPDGERFDDYRDELVDDVVLSAEIEAYGVTTGILTDAASFVAQLREQHIAKAQDVDGRFPANEHAEMVDGRVVIKRPRRPEASAELRSLDQLLTSRLEPVSIMDVLIESTRWLRLHTHFRTASGAKGRLPDLLGRFITTLFCYGCNLGPTQTVRSVRGLSRKQVAWLNLQYVTEGDLDKAIVKVINAYNRYELPRFWGSGKRASADGTQWSVYENNLLSERHIRYGGYGGIGYYHVSDTYIALMSHFITCGTYEAIYILDGLLANKSDIQPDTVHGDTHAQSLPVFALAFLLGIKLMPRIARINSLAFSKPDGKIKYENIESLFNDTIDWTLIETHFPEMLRVAVSIKLGKVTASAILRRLGTFSKKNKIYFAFRELGKVVRTLFLLDYIDDVEVRKVIHAATNKSEEFNQFVKWAFFGGEGIIQENVLHEQRKVVKYSHLVANLVILHNVEGMTRALNGLQQEGHILTSELLSGLAPYRTAHVNRFGDYMMDLNRPVGRMNHDQSIAVRPDATVIDRPLE